MGVNSCPVERPSWNSRPNETRIITTKLVAATMPPTTTHACSGAYRFTIKKRVSDESRAMPAVGSNEPDSEKRCTITEFLVL